MGSGYDAIVLAGGTGRRLDGVDKADLDIAGATLLGRAVESVASAERVIVVADPRPLPRKVVWTREQPPGTGPVAAIAAGLAKVRAPVVVVVACDMPMLTTGTIERLRSTLAASHPADATMLVDDNGRRQLLAGAYRRQALTIALHTLGDPQNQSMRALVATMRIIDVVSVGSEALDCDTWDDVRRSQAMLRRGDEGHDTAPRHQPDRAERLTEIPKETR
jgi:molybdopterin-guanine dinucleotide biosynthesis protein A